MCVYPTLNFQTFYPKQTYFLFGLVFYCFSLTMYADWASLQDEIKFDKANESVLHRYPGPVGRDVACHVVKTIAQNLSFSVSNPDPSNLLTDKEVKWTMEVGLEA